MACPDSVLIDKDLEFSIATHDPETGALADADEFCGEFKENK